MTISDPDQSQSSPESSSALRNWLFSGVVCVLLIGLIGFGLFHIAFRIPSIDLWKAYGFISPLTFFMFAAMYWANKRSRPSDRLRRRVIVMGTYMFLTSIVGIYYAAQAGIMSVEDVVGLSIFMTIGIVISSILAYFIRKKLSGRA